MKTTNRRGLWQALMVLFATFGAGILTGRSMQSDPEPGPNPTTDVMSRIGDQLELTAEQSGRFDDVLSRRGDLIANRMNEAIDFIRQQTDSAEREIRELLSDPQQARFDSLLQNERSRMRLRRPAPPERTDPGGGSDRTRRRP